MLFSWELEHFASIHGNCSGIDKKESNHLWHIPLIPKDTSFFQQDYPNQGTECIWQVYHSHKAYSGRSKAQYTFWSLSMIAFSVHRPERKPYRYYDRMAFQIKN